MPTKSDFIIPKGKIAVFCKKNYIKKLSLFGSSLHDDFGPESDVDMLVEFDQDHIPGLITLAGMEIELRTRASIENDRKPALALVKAVEIICEAVSKTNCHELGNEQGLVIRKVIYTFVKVVNVESNPTSQTGWKSKKNYIETIEII